jgi:hypothetical protein
MLGAIFIPCPVNKCVATERVGVQGNGSEKISANNDSLKRSSVAFSNHSFGENMIQSFWKQVLLLVNQGIT